VGSTCCPSGVLTRQMKTSGWDSAKQRTHQGYDTAHRGPGNRAAGRRTKLGTIGVWTTERVSWLDSRACGPHGPANPFRSSRSREKGFGEGRALGVKGTLDGEFAANRQADSAGSDNTLKQSGGREQFLLPLRIRRTFEEKKSSGVEFQPVIDTRSQEDEPRNGSPTLTIHPKRNRTRLHSPPA
jgi:hypothetical protein